MTKVMILNGPNLNLLGAREAEVYGRTTLAQLDRQLVAEAETLGIEIDTRQSNHEGDLVDWIQEAREDCSAILVNAGGYTHTSVAILDALRAFPGIVVEVHVTNIHARESYRHHSYISSRADALIAGFGTDGYLHALRHLAARLSV